MEPNGPQPEFDSLSKPDFYENLLPNAPTEDKAETGHSNIEDVDDLNKAVADMMAEHPDYEILNVADSILGVRIAVVKLSDNRILILREDLWNQSLG